MQDAIVRLSKNRTSVLRMTRVCWWLFCVLLATMVGLTIGRDVGGTTGAWMAVAVSNSLALYAIARQERVSLALADKIASLERELAAKNAGGV